jgi:hypothetical protein
MRPRGWASTILAEIAGVVGAAQPSIRCSTQIYAYWGASQHTDEPLVIVLLIGLAMAANCTLWATP